MNFPVVFSQVFPIQFPSKNDLLVSEQATAKRNFWVRFAIGTTALAVGITAYFSHQFVRSLLLENLQRNAFLEVQQQATQLDRWLGTRKAEVGMMANTETMRSLDWSIVQPYMQEETKRIQDFIAFAMVSPNGNVFHSRRGPNSANIKDRQHFQVAIFGNSYVSDPMISRVLKVPQFIIATPIWSNDASNRAPIGVFQGIVLLDRLTQVVNQLKYGEGSYAFALNSRGEPIVHPNQTFLSNLDKPAPSFLQSADNDLAKIAHRMVHKGRGIELIPIDGTQKYVAFIPLQEANWSVALVIPRQNIDNQLRLLDLIAIVVVGLVVGMIFILWQVQNFEHAQLRQSKAASDAAKQQLQQNFQELQLAQAQLVQSEKMSSLGRLVAGIAHEINNPVNFIHGNITYASEYLQDLMHLITLYQAEYPQPSPKISEQVDKIDLEFIHKDLSNLLTSMKTGSERISEIVRSLRSFSRLDEAELKPVNIHEGIDSALMILQSRLQAPAIGEGLAEAARAEIQVIKEYGELPWVECFSGELNQVFMNILSNAIDALEENNPPQPYIHISTVPLSDDQVEIYITDNGPGIPKHIQQWLFDPFFTTKEVGKGTGLGLAISRQIIVEQHGGQLEVKSTVNEGTTFCIRLPITVNA
ncbi:ATP-binding protein [Alkalinema sp. FACHB-956]|uniref:sensor histidine kinase n=1 Tax=Alkalinema sp. FACHB-956 TaxID=2692768 RepID=UPI001684E9E1|nr:ATP-binding protein [Alkalinema sp. FACHB-956]MBD2329607.1 GHKL domain-containing protein [Alkalinema sp. FACHB-956]